MKNTTQVMYVMAQDEREYTRKELLESTNLYIKQLDKVIQFLKAGNIIKVRYEKTSSRPYRKAIYSLNQEKYEYIIKLLERDGIEI